MKPDTPSHAAPMDAVARKIRTPVICYPIKGLPYGFDAFGGLVHDVIGSRCDPCPRWSRYNVALDLLVALVQKPA